VHNPGTSKRISCEGQRWDECQAYVLNTRGGGVNYGILFICSLLYEYIILNMYISMPYTGLSRTHPFSGGGVRISRGNDGCRVHLIRLREFARYRQSNDRNDGYCRRIAIRESGSTALKKNEIVAVFVLKRQSCEFPWQRWAAIIVHIYLINVSMGSPEGTFKWSRVKPNMSVCSVWVPCVALPSGGGSSAGSPPLCGSPVGGVLSPVVFLCPMAYILRLASPSCSRSRCEYMHSQAAELGVPVVTRAAIIMHMYTS